MSILRTLGWLKYMYFDRLLGRGHPVDNAQWNREYTDGHWDYLKSDGEIARYELIAAYLNRFTNCPHLLDVGCGEGILLDFLPENSIATYTGMDLSENAIEKAAHRADGKTKFHVRNVAEYVPAEHFGAIVMNEVLFYLKKPIETLTKYADQLDPDGVMIVSMLEPSAEKIWPRIERSFIPKETNIVTGNTGLRWQIGVFVRDQTPPAAKKK